MREQKRMSWNGTAWRVEGKEASLGAELWAGVTGQSLAGCKMLSKSLSSWSLSVHICEVGIVIVATSQGACED